MKRFFCIQIIFAILLTTMATAQSPPDYSNPCEDQLIPLANHLASLSDDALRSAATNTTALRGDTSGKLDTVYYDIANVTIARITKHTRKSSEPGTGKLMNTHIAVRVISGEENVIVWVLDQSSGTTGWVDVLISNEYLPSTTDICAATVNLRMARQYADVCIAKDVEKALAKQADSLANVPNDALQMLSESALGLYEEFGWQKVWHYGQVVVGKNDSTGTTQVIVYPSEAPLFKKYATVFFGYDQPTKVTRWAGLTENDGIESYVFPTAEDQDFYNRYAAKLICLTLWQAKLVELQHE